MKRTTLPSNMETKTMIINKEYLLKGKFIIPAIVTCWTFLNGNETIFPTALVMTLLCIVLTINGSEGKTGSVGTSPLGAAGRPAIFTFSVLIAISNIVVSVFLPGYAGVTTPPGGSGGEFVQVTIHNFHVFAYLTAFFLIICMTFIVYSRWLQSRHQVSGMRPAAG